MNFRLLIINEKNDLIFEYSNELIHEDDNNYLGLINLIEPLSLENSTFIYSLKLGEKQIDIFYNNKFYTICIISNDNLIEFKKYNIFFIIIFSNYIFNEFLKNNFNLNKDNIQNIISKIPNNIYLEISNLINLIKNFNFIEKITFLTEGNKILFSIGECNESPEEFIISWCTVLNSINNFLNEEFIKIEKFKFIFIFKFLNNIFLIIYFKKDIKNNEINEFYNNLKEIQFKLFNLFIKTQQFKPKMPEMPNNSRNKKK